jgi:hypothetical protein
LPRRKKRRLINNPVWVIKANFSVELERAMNFYLKMPIHLGSHHFHTINRTLPFRHPQPRLFDNLSSKSGYERIIRRIDDPSGWTPVESSVATLITNQQNPSRVLD